MKAIHIVLLMLLPMAAGAQVKVAYADAPQSYATGVAVHADPRLDEVLSKHKAAMKTNGGIYSGHGYRVQIYNGNDRSRATAVKLDFMRRFPGVRTYLTYVSPHFRVKVGDYRSRGDAQKMYDQVSALYNPVMIVPDIVVINTVNNQKDKDD